MAAESAPANEHHEGGAHSEKHYVKIWAILVGLLVLSVIGPLVSEGLEEGSNARLALTLSTAFGIAVVKAYYVVKHFMHLTVEPKYVAYICTTGLAFMALFFFFVAPDVMKHEGRNWSNVSAQRAVAGELGEDVDEPLSIEQPDMVPAPEIVEEPRREPPVEPVAEVVEPPSPPTPPPGISEAERRQRARFIEDRLFRR